MTKIMQNSINSNTDDRIISSSVANFLLLMMYTLILISRLSGNATRYCFFAEFFFACMAHLYIYPILHKMRKYNKFMQYVMFFSALLIINMLLIGNIRLKAVIYAAWIWPMIALLIYFTKPSISLLHGLFVYAVFLISNLWIKNGSPDGIMVNSRNYIVFFLFLYALPYFYYCYRENKLPFLAYPIICLIVAVLAVGRGGIIMALILLMGWLIEYTSKAKHKILVVSLITICCICIGLCVVNPMFFNNYFSRFVDRGMHSLAREHGWVDYINSLSSIPHLLFGTNIDSVSRYVSDVLGGSLHNSYLTIHARMGVFGFLYFAMIVHGLIALLKKRKWFMFFYFFAICVKAFVDVDFPGTGVGGDINIYLLFLISLNSKSDSRKVRVQIV